jgi:hypothetical protein
VIYASVNADMSFQWAVDGVIALSFEPLLYPEMSWAGERLPEEEGLPSGLPQALSSAFACAESHAGQIDPRGPGRPLKRVGHRSHPDRQPLTLRRDTSSRRSYWS